MHTLTATALRERFCNGSLSAVEIARYFLQRIEQHDPAVKAFLAVHADAALAQAEALDAKRAAGQRLGPLAGVPVALKDNINVAGHMTTCGSRFLSNYRSPYNATAARLLLDADAILIGKTNCDEFAMGSSTENSAYHPTNNPWDLSCSPGGSSGGSAAAVAARLVPLALGSDTGGSIRQPASLCGVVGFKPTYGRVSRFGLVAFGSSLDQIGPFANSVEDVALAMEVLGTHCPLDSTSVPRGPDRIVEQLATPIEGLRIGVPWHFLEQLNSESRRVFDEAVATLKAKGASIVEVDLSLLKYSIAIYYILATAEASTNLARFDGIRYGQRAPEATTLEEVYDLSRQAGFGAEVKRRILLGTFVLSSGYQDAYYKKAQKVRRLIIDQFHDAFQQCDCIAMPVSPFVAFQLGSIKDPLQMYLEDIYTIGANLAGLPAVSVPAGTIANKPIGLQILGPQLQDALVCRVAHAFRSAPTAIPGGYQ